METTLQDIYRDPKAPWRGFGTAIPENVSPAEANRLAGLDFEVGKVPVLAQYPLGPVAVEGFSAVVRVDESGLPAGAPWAILSDRYVPAQNSVVADFFEALRAEDDGLRMHTAFPLDGGRRCVWLADIGTIDVIPGDPIHYNLRVTNAHDGTSSLRASLMAVRRRCWNTATVAMRNALKKDRTIHVRHTGDIDLKMAHAADVLASLRAEAEAAADVFRGLAEIRVTEAQVEDIIVQVFPGESTRSENVRAQVRGLYANSSSIRIPGVEGTAWGVFNAVTEYVDHYARQSRTAEQRLSSSWYGAGEETKEHALQQIHVVTGTAPAVFEV